MRKSLIKYACAILVFALCIPNVALAAESRASEYIDSYSAKTNATGNGNVLVEFTVSGTGFMDKIGSPSIYLYEKKAGSSSWSIVKIFTSASYPSLMKESAAFHSGSVSYAGTSGNQYYSMVYVRAEKNGGGDTRTYTTTTITA